MWSPFYINFHNIRNIRFYLGPLLQDCQILRDHTKIMFFAENDSKNYAKYQICHQLVIYWDFDWFLCGGRLRFWEFVMEFRVLCINQRLTKIIEAVWGLKKVFQGQI